MKESDLNGGLSEDQLDRALLMSAVDVSVSDSETLRDIVRGARRAAEPRARHRRQWTAVALLGSFAAIGVAAALVPPSDKGTDPFFYRTPAGIRLTWTTSDGSTTSCLARFGFEHPTPAQENAIETYLESHDWRPLNRRLERAGAFSNTGSVTSSSFSSSGFESALREAGQAASDAAVGSGAPKVVELSLACGGPE